MGAGDEQRLRRLLGDSDSDSDVETSGANLWSSIAPDTSSVNSPAENFAPGLRLPQKKQNVSTTGYSHARVQPDAIAKQSWSTDDPKKRPHDVTEAEDNEEVTEDMAEPLAATFGTTNLRQNGGFYSKKLEAQGVPKEVMSQFKENFYTNRSATRQIINYIGDQIVPVALKTETRLQFLRDDSTTLRPDLGNVPKRFKKQHALNIRERKEQVLSAARLLAMWKSLTQEERVRRLKKLRQPIRFMNDDPGFVDASDLVEVIEIPEIYTRSIEFSTVSADILETPEMPEIYTRSVDLGSYMSHGIPASINVRYNSPRLQGVSSRAYRSQRSRHSQRSHTSQHGRRSQRSSHSRPSLQPSSRAGPLYNFDDFNNAFDTSTEASGRNREEIANLLGELISPQDGRTPNGYSSAESTDAANDYDLNHFDLSPEMAPAENLPESSPLLAVSPVAELEKQLEALRITSTKFGRAIIVQLVKAVKFTPGAFTKRIWGGIIAEFQFFPRDHLCIAVFLAPTNAEAFIRHVVKLTNKVRALETGNREKFWSPDPGGRGWTTLSDLLSYMQQRDGKFGEDKIIEWRDLQAEIRALQFDEVKWYRGSQLESIVHQPGKVLQAKIYAKASRVLLLKKGIIYGTTKEELKEEVILRLRKLEPAVMVVSLALVKPLQKYKQATEGCTAVVEFKSIADAYTARQELMQEYEPEFLEDPCDRQPDMEHEYCNCASCEHMRASGSAEVSSE